MWLLARLESTLGRLHIPTTEIDINPALTLMNPGLLTVLALELLDSLDSERLPQKDTNPILLSLLMQRQLISLLDFIVVAVELARYGIINPGVIPLIRTPDEAYTSFADILEIICRMVRALTEVQRVGPYLPNVSPFDYSITECRAITCTPLRDLPFPLQDYIYSLNQVSLRRVGVRNAPDDVPFSFNLCLTLTSEVYFPGQQTYLTTLHEPAPSWPNPELFTTIEPELVEISQLPVRESLSDDAAIVLCQSKTSGKEEKPLVPTRITVNLETNSVTSSPLRPEDTTHAFSKLNDGGCDKRFQPSPSGSPNTSIRTSLDEKSAGSITLQHGPDSSPSTDSLDGESKVHFNPVVEVDPGRFYEPRPFDEMHDVLSTVQMINSMSFQIHTLEQQVTEATQRNQTLAQKLMDATIKISFQEARLEQVTRDKDARIAELEREVAALTATSSRSSRAVPEISFSPAQALDKRPFRHILTAGYEITLHTEPSDISETALSKSTSAAVRPKKRRSEPANRRSVEQPESPRKRLDAPTRPPGSPSSNARRNRYIPSAGRERHE